MCHVASSEWCGAKYFGEHKIISVSNMKLFALGKKI